MVHTFIIKTVLTLTLISSTMTGWSDSHKKSKVFNPDTGLNFLTLYQNGTRKDHEKKGAPYGFSLQEIELQFTADVDPYFRGTALLGIHTHNKEEHGDDDHGNHDDDDDDDNDHDDHEDDDKNGHATFLLEPEEVYVETLAIPITTIKVGKFRLAIGKHNTLHTHAYPFIDAPLTQQTLIGSEGLAQIGLSSAFLIPTPWYMDLTLQVVESSSKLFSSDNPNDFVYLTKLMNLWDLSDSMTFELGLSGALGKNKTKKWTNLYGTDMTFKWRPDFGGKYTSLSWTTEYLFSEQKGIEQGKGALSSWIQYQFSRRWWLQARAEIFGLPKGDEEKRINKQSLLVGFFSSEFSALRLQFDNIDDHEKTPERRVVLQLNISLGAHPAHTY